MNDDISKEYLKEHIKACWINGRPKYSPELHEVLSWIDDVPPAQPEKRTEEHMKTHACDCISRQAAIDAIKALWNNAPSAQHVSAMFDCEDAIRALPSAQPEIIHCRECKHHIDGRFCRMANHHTPEFDYCASVFGAERREE